MNKLDALIADLAPEMQLGPTYPLANAAAIRRILEAVREDMAIDDTLCTERACDKTQCSDCPRTHHHATRQALEQLT